MSRKLISFFAAIAISTAVIAPASAESVTRSVSVLHADLDLSHAEGVKALKSRINHAVDAVCGKVRASSPLVLQGPIRACRKDAMASAVTAMNAVLLAASHEKAKGDQFAGR